MTLRCTTVYDEKKVTSTARNMCKITVEYIPYAELFTRECKDGWSFAMTYRRFHNEYC